MTATSALPVGQRQALAAALGALGRGRLGHAHLVVGAAGSGRGLFAEVLARAQFCASPEPSGVPCGACAECARVAAGRHPDVHWLGSEGKLGIEEARALNRQASLGSTSGRCAVFVIEACERLTGPAAAALLKTLEDPPGPVLFLLLAEHPDRVEPTLRSRCVQLRLVPVASERLERWLAEVRPTAPAAARAAAARGCAGLPGRALAALDAGDPAAQPVLAHAASLAAALSAQRLGLVMAAATELAGPQGPTPDEALGLLRDAWGHRAGLGVTRCSAAETDALEQLPGPISPAALAAAGRACLQAQAAAEANVNATLNWFVLLERLRRLCGAC